MLPKNHDRPSAYLELGWTQNNMAVNIHGDECSPHSEQAVAYCMLGSVQASSLYLGMDEERTLRQALAFVIKRNYADRSSILERSPAPIGYSDIVARANDDIIESQDEAIKVMRTAEFECGLWDD